jgi:hypothetical protein
MENPAPLVQTSLQIRLIQATAAQPIPALTAATADIVITVPPM